MTASPYVLSFIGSDDPLRGDSQAVKGLGKAFADKTGRSWVMLDDKIVTDLYPGHTPDEAYDLFFADHGEPEIVLSNSRNLQGRAFPQSHVISGNNEELSKLYNPDLPSLVSHHHTQSSLEEAGREFRKYFPCLTRPLIALMHIETGLRHQDLAEQIVAMIGAENHCAATVFICGTRRTPVQAQIDLLSSLRREIGKSGLEVDVKNYLLGPQFNRSEDFNPYAGLIATADHFILAGESKSIISECLFSGKSVMTFGTSYRDLESYGFAHYLKHHDTRKGFPTRTLPPLNVTELMAEAMIEKYELETGRAARASRPQLDDLRPL